MSSSGPVIPQDRKVRSLGCLKTARVVVEHSKCDIPSKYSRFSQFLLKHFSISHRKTEVIRRNTSDIARAVSTSYFFIYIGSKCMWQLSFKFFSGRAIANYSYVHIAFTEKYRPNPFSEFPRSFIRHSSSYSGMQIVSCLLLRTCILQIRTGICSTMKHILHHRDHRKTSETLWHLPQLVCILHLSFRRLIDLECPRSVSLIFAAFHILEHFNHSLVASLSAR